MEPLRNEGAEMSKLAPLAGITVVELGHSVAAPYAGLVLADLGARVIKVENPGGGDYARGWGPPFHNGTSTVFHSLNRGKQDITVNFADPADAAALRRLIVEQADAVIQNLRPGLLEKFGFDAEAMRAEKPSLIWCDIGAFGARGPMSQKPGYDPLAQASSGIMSVTGEPDRPPVRVGVSLVDMGAGMWIVIGLLSALIGRAKTGEGSRISTSLFEAALAWMTTPLAAHAQSGEVRKPQGSGLAEIVPYQAFEARDGWVMISAGNDKLFAKLCSALPELKALSEDPRFTENRGRVELRDELVPRIAEAIKGYTMDEVGQILDTVGVPNCPLLRIDQVWNHPQLAAVDILAESDGLKVMGIPISFDSERPRAMGAAPALGDDNARYKD